MTTLLAIGYDARWYGLPISSVGVYTADNLTTT